jgi:hypothetical protein
VDKEEGDARGRKKRWRRPVKCKGMSGESNRREHQPLIRLLIYYCTHLDSSVRSCPSGIFCDS